jgi:hypothetical protein
MPRYQLKKSSKSKNGTRHKKQTKRKLRRGKSMKVGGGGHKLKSGRTIHPMDYDYDDWILAGSPYDW